MFSRSLVKNSEKVNGQSLSKVNGKVIGKILFFKKSDILKGHWKVSIKEIRFSQRSVERFYQRNQIFFKGHCKRFYP